MKYLKLLSSGELVMKSELRKRLVKRILFETLSRMRLYGNLEEREFAERISDFPKLLREWASQLEDPPKDLIRSELPGLESYSRWAKVYDDDSKNNPVIAGEEAVVWDLIGDVKSLRVLDVSCGTGRHAIPVAKKGAKVLAFDPSSKMLTEAKKKAQKENLEIDFRLGTVENIRSNMGEFDLVLCCLVLSHVPDLTKAVSALASCVSSKGSLIVSDFHPLNILIGFRTSFDLDEQNYLVPNYPHLPSEYFRVIQDAGLEVTHYYEKGELDRLPGLPMTIIFKAKAL